MTPADLQQLLIAHLPAIEGVESAAPWPGRPYGLAVHLTRAGSAYWMVTGAEGTAGSAHTDKRLPPQPKPELNGPKTATAQVEQALLTALAAGDTESQVIRADRYSTRPTPPTVGYGLTIDCTDTWRLFVTCVATTRQREEPHTSRYYHPDSEL